MTDGPMAVRGHELDVHARTADSIGTSHTDARAAGR